MFLSQLSQGDPADVSLSVLEKPPRFGPSVSSSASDPMLPLRKRTQGGASLCPGLSPFAPLGRTDRSTRKSSVITQHAGTVPGYFLMVCRPAGPRANKGGHSTGALRPRQRVCRPSRPENHFMKGLSLAVPSPEGWQTLCRWCEPPVPDT